MSRQLELFNKAKKKWDKKVQTSVKRDYNFDTLSGESLKPLYYWQKKRPILPLLIPMFFVMGITITALVANAIQFYGQNSILFGLTIILMGLIIWMAYEGVNKVLEIRRTS